MDRIPSGRFKVADGLFMVVEDKEGNRVFSLEKDGAVISNHLAGYSALSDRNAVSSLFLIYLGLSA